MRDKRSRNSPFPLALLSPLKKESMISRSPTQQNCSKMQEPSRLLPKHKNEKAHAADAARAFK